MAAPSKSNCAATLAPPYPPHGPRSPGGVERSMTPSRRRYGLPSEASLTSFREAFLPSVAACGLFGPIPGNFLQSFRQHCLAHALLLSRQVLRR
jgi:hypothetical protein